MKAQKPMAILYLRKFEAAGDRQFLGRATETLERLAAMKRTPPGLPAEQRRQPRY